MSSDAGVGPSETERSVGWLRLALEIPVLLLTAAVIAVIVKGLLAQAFYIPSESMFPQLTAGDRVVVSRLSYRLHEPRRGDLVVFDDPQVVASDGGLSPGRLLRDAVEAVGLVRPEDRELIKRVIALPGERVWGESGAVYVDGFRLYEPYLPDDVVISDFEPVVVPDGHVFVMGDNRTNSKDSRRFGPIDVDSIVGRAIGRIWPLDRIAFL